MTTRQRTRAEIEALKTEWLSDPCWDLENSEGYEEHFEELRAFSEQYWREVSNRVNIQLAVRSRMLGCSVQLVEYIETLEQAIEALSERIRKLEAE